ncbi:MAG: glyoxalase superfamily protein [Mesorhizobium sp.]|nr:glyoxalase superfamily protein [Mesorhizobium sp.]
MPSTLPPTDRPATRDQAKRRAHALREDAAARGVSLSLAAALERVAVELGYRDWNTASARLSNAPPVPLQVGDRVAGRYLKQPFEGRVLAVRELADGGAFEVTLHFDQPVDVVECESFSNFRQRVDATISADGVSWSRTSDGQPHLVVARR